MKPESYFAECALRYEECFFAGGDVDENALRDLLKRLVDLLGAGLKLTAQADVDFNVDADEICEERLALARRRASRIPIGMYWDALQPVDLNEDRLVVGDIQDDLIDILIGVARSSRLYSSGCRREAVWHWREDMQSHWAAHAVSAAKILTAHLCSRAQLIGAPLSSETE